MMITKIKIAFHRNLNMKIQMTIMKIMIKNPFIKRKPNNITHDH